jgi:prepilin-type N-terminal cleavage/methylation domain-containing protein
MRRAFTLIEIMVVVGIIIILVVIAAPSILRSRIVANESAALANLRTLNNACQLYHINKEAYSNNLQDLAEPASSPPYIDPELASGHKQGYEFNYSLIDADRFTVNANPTTSGLLRGRYFFMDETGMIRANPSQPAGAGDEIVK